ncbi:hypothetical protein AB0A63_31200 [Lentzea sp. NPDC042327]|uniref:hypothetical protein n=1 Tax=Lentzea sp. NPDC042327 TaxID=3154801 RepID=UPI0033C7C29F
MNSTEFPAGSAPATTPTTLARVELPDTVRIDEAAEVQGLQYCTDHYIETFGKLYLVWGETGWEVASVMVDGHPLDLGDDEHERRDNTECNDRKDDDQECDAADHVAAVQRVYDLCRVPTGSELVGLLGAAVLDIHPDCADPAYDELMELYDLARQTPHHELGDRVLRTLFRRQLNSPRVTKSLAVDADGTQVMRMSAGAHAALAGVIAPAYVVDSDELFYDDAIHEEHAQLFPAEAFHRRLADPAASDLTYDVEAE